MALHLGLRVDGIYIDPLAYLIDRPRPRLAPLPRPGGLAGPDPGVREAHTGPGLAGR